MRNKKAITLPHVCRNCGTPLQGKYCHVCGQSAISGVQRTVGNIAFGFLDSMFSVDNKAFVTIKYLLVYPGKLSKEYVAGRVNSYVHPSKLFWFISILFFTLLTYTVDLDKVIVNNNAHKNNLAGVDSVVNEKGSKAKLTNNFKDSLKRNDVQPINADIKCDTVSTDLSSDFHDIINVDDVIDKKDFMSQLITYAPYVMFLLIPFFALLLYIFFRKKAHFYVDHLIFSVHYHAFIFTFYGLCILFYMLYPQLNPTSKLLLGVPFVYFIIALYNFYHPRKRALLIKPFIICFIYLIGFLIILIFFLIIITVISSKVDISTLIGKI